MFDKYPHLERFGTDEVDGINTGKCYVFPKLDGTNASVWFDGGIRAGSRNRELSLEADNAGFLAWASVENRLEQFFNETRFKYRLFGEWLVPHSIKAYREDAWRKFYIFDVKDETTGEWLSYDEYQPLLESYGLDYIPVQAVVKNPDYDYLLREAKANTFLMQDGAGCGEGVVIKQYGRKNRFGYTTWAKLVTNEFREANAKAFGAKQHECDLIEQRIVDEFLTGHVVDKVVEKIRLDNGMFTAKDIPRLLNQTWHEFVVEEMWEILKKHKNPKIDFRTLNQCVIQKIKEHKRELFGGK